MSDGIVLEKRYTDRAYRKVLVILVILIVGLKYKFEIFRIPSASMNPTLLAQDYILVDEWAYGFRIPFTQKWISRWSKPKRGQVVVFWHPQNDYVMIKRVVGLPGDVLAFNNQTQVYFINGEPIQEEYHGIQGKQSYDACLAQMKSGDHPLLQNPPFNNKYQRLQYGVATLPQGKQHLVQIDNRTPKKLESFEKTLKEDEYFMMGDFRSGSHDSRYWGPVPLKNIYGPATQVLWSLSGRTQKCKGLLGDHSNLMRWNRTLKKID